MTEAMVCETFNEGRKLMTEAMVCETFWRVKEEIKYAFPHWAGPGQTLEKKRGNCAIKSELLAHLLRKEGVIVRYVEGRPGGWNRTIMQMYPLNVHFWLEAWVNNQWLTLDPTPDSGVTHFLGDTKPGTHLTNPKWVTRWDELPPWYRESYNMKLFYPLRFLTNIQLFFLRRFKCLSWMMGWNS